MPGMPPEDLRPPGFVRAAGWNSIFSKARAKNASNASQASWTKSATAMASAPSWITDATVGTAYANAAKLAGQMAVFMRQLGFKAVASMNDLGVNAAYAVAAGLGEGGRNGG